MQPFQQRVVDERSELNWKIEKLQSFLETDSFKALGQAEQERMKRQAVVMQQYSDILSARIKAFHA